MVTPRGTDRAAVPISDERWQSRALFCASVTSLALTCRSAMDVNSHAPVPRN